MIRSGWSRLVQKLELIYIETDGHDYIDLARRPIQECIYFMGSAIPPSMRYAFSDKIIIPYVRV